MQYNPTITQISPSKRTYKVIGLSVGHNDKGFVTGRDIAYIRYLDGNCEVKAVEIRHNKK